jgi:D-alanyl-D-alanine carboxypeptidase (penicillin-binding protein 5/6)
MVVFMSTTKKKKSKKKSRLRMDRVFLCIGVLALLLASIIYGISYIHDNTINIPVYDYFKSIRASMSYDTIEDTSTEVSDIDLEDYSKNLLSNLSSEDISAQYVYILDKTNNQILFDKDSTSKCYPASTTKLLTAIIAIEYIDLDTIFTVGTEINLIESDSSLAYLVQGEQISLKDLLYGMLLPSGNDAAYTIAVNTARILTGNPILSDSDAVDYFVDLMNKKAQEIGMYDSNFVVPDGMYNKNHYVTAQDMMKLLLYAETIDEFKEIVSTQTYSTTVTSGEQHTWVNSNKLIDEDGAYYYKGVTGVKTGFHDYAGNCLLISANIDNREVYVVMMKSETDTSRYEDATLLLDSIYQ